MVEGRFSKDSVNQISKKWELIPIRLESERGVQEIVIVLPYAIPHETDIILSFFHLSPVGLLGLISLLLHISRTGSFHQRASCLSTRARKTLRAALQHVPPLLPPHPRLWPRAHSRVPAPGKSRTSCSHSLFQTDKRENLKTEGLKGQVAGLREAGDNPQQRPAEEIHQ